MQELQKALEISVSGAHREEILDAVRLQLDTWNVSLPDVEPLVLDFGLDRFQDVGLVEAWICNEALAGYCGKYLFLLDGQTCPTHRHREKTETFFVAKGTIEVCLDGEKWRMAEGDTLLIEPWTPHSMTGLGPALILEISTPCRLDDNYFENPDIPIGGNYGGGAL